MFWYKFSEIKPWDVLPLIKTKRADEPVEYYTYDDNDKRVRHYDNYRNLVYVTPKYIVRYKSNTPDDEDFEYVYKIDYSRKFRNHDEWLMNTLEGCEDSEVFEWSVIEPNKYFIRFGNIPENGKSSIWKNGELKIGEELGVSVYNADIDVNGKWYPKPMFTTDTFINSVISDSLKFRKHYDDSPVYLVTGDVLNQSGHDSEPLLKNVKTLMELGHNLSLDKKFTIYLSDELLYM